MALLSSITVDSDVSSAITVSSTTGATACVVVSSGSGGGVALTDAAATFCFFCFC